MCFCFVIVSRTIEVGLPQPPPEYSSLPHWLSELTDSKLKKLLEQGDSQRVRELSLALITVLNEVSEAQPHNTDKCINLFYYQLANNTLFTSYNFFSV